MPSPFQYIGGPAAVIGNAVGDVGKTLEELHQQSYKNQLDEQNAQTENEHAQLGYYGKMGVADTNASSREDVQSQKDAAQAAIDAAKNQTKSYIGVLNLNGKLANTVAGMAENGVLTSPAQVDQFLDQVAANPGRYGVSASDAASIMPPGSNQLPGGSTGQGTPVPPPPPMPTPFAPIGPGGQRLIAASPDAKTPYTARQIPPPGSISTAGQIFPPTVPGVTDPSAPLPPGVKNPTFPGVPYAPGIAGPFTNATPSQMQQAGLTPAAVPLPPPAPPMRGGWPTMNPPAPAPVVPGGPGANPNMPSLTQVKPLDPYSALPAWGTPARVLAANAAKERADTGATIAPSQVNRNDAQAQYYTAQSGLRDEQARLAPGIANALVNVHNAQAKADILRAGTAEKMVGVAAQKLGMQSRELQLRAAAESDPQLKSALSIYAMGTKYLGSDSGASGIDPQTRQNVMSDMSNAYQIIRQRMSAQQATPGTPASPNMPSITQIKPLNPLSQGARTWNGPPVRNSADFNRLYPQQKQEYTQIFYK